MSSPALARARTILSVAGYDENHVESEYPVWLGGDAGVAVADIVAFGRSAPKNMSTAVITVGQGSIEFTFEIARAIAAPYFILAGDDLELWVAESTRPVRWREDFKEADVAELASWLRPSFALTTKVGLRQLALFDVPINLLASARSDSADRLGPIVRDALGAASSMLGESAVDDSEIARRRLHRGAARLVVGALTVLVMRDRDNRGVNRALSTESLIHRTVNEESSTFSWFPDTSPAERQILMSLVEQLGTGIDYQSLDPAILAQVYEEALVDDDDRKQLGIHYTPPRLASRLLFELPVETIAPDDRHVLDPCCGSGTLLVAAHDRLRELQPPTLSEADRHRDLAVHLHGYDIEPIAAEIARLTLQLHAQPAGNGWQVEELDTLDQPTPAIPPKIIVTNPPWRFASDVKRTQAADDFLRWSMEALAPGGVLGILLPASWLSAQNSAATRRDFLEQFEIFETWRLPEGTFPTSQVASAALLARKRDGLGGRGARVMREITSSTLPSFLGGAGVRETYLVSAIDTPLGEAAPAPTVRADTRPLAQIAEIKSGNQLKKGVQDHGAGTPYLAKMGYTNPYGLVPEDAVWHVAFPDDFTERTRGRSIIDKKKVLASAARSSNNPWRFRVAIDHQGIVTTHSVRGIAPIDQSDDDLLYALAIIVGSGFASTFAASFGGDRNISAEVLPRIPVPTSRATLDRLAGYGRRAVGLANDSRALNALLVDAEAAVWDAYGVPEEERIAAAVRLAGHRAPEGMPRYRSPGPPLQPRQSTFRHVGVVLGIEDGGLRLWVNGITPDEGTVMAYPPQMPGWLARAGATFDVTGVETLSDLGSGQFRLQPMSWQDLDLDSDEPIPVLSR
jgi:hypothetical protein